VKFFYSSRISVCACQHVGRELICQHIYYIIRLISCHAMLHYTGTLSIFWRFFTIFNMDFN